MSSKQNRIVSVVIRESLTPRRPNNVCINPILSRKNRFVINLATKLVFKYLEGRITVSYDLNGGI